MSLLLENLLLLPCDFVISFLVVPTFNFQSGLLFSFPPSVAFWYQ